LPLAFFVPPARQQSGQGARVAGKITTFSLASGTLLTAVILGAALGMKALWVGLAAAVMMVASGAYYRRRIGGVTGDCLGATNQLTEVAIYFAGVVLQ
jgi:adenosylcobinamide-GDP ribazoletransferase